MEKLTPDQWRLVEDHRYLARNISRAMIPASWWEDGTQEGMLALADAALRYIPVRCDRFASFAAPIVVCKLIDFRNSLLPGPKHSKEYVHRLRKAGVDPAFDGVLPEDHIEAAARRMKPETVADRRRLTAHGVHLLFWWQDTDRDGCTSESRREWRRLQESLVSQDASPEQAIEAEYDRQRIRDTVSRLPTMERRAVELVDFGGISTTEAASQLGLSVVELKAFIDRAHAALRLSLSDLCL